MGHKTQTNKSVSSDFTDKNIHNMEAILRLMLATLVLSAGVQPLRNTCTCPDDSSGRAVVGQDGCHVCYTGPYGVRCVNTNTTDQCLAKGPTYQAGSPACTYGTDGNAVGTYIGDVFTARDGCNTCLCTEQGLVCTGKPCSNGAFAEPHQDLYGHCRYREAGDNVWYTLNSQWQAVDGCNTCVCVAVGNYQGQYICTNGICVHPHRKLTHIIVG
ncbi:uncharacterized protein [Argopecten irradians]|uniref:uncharacterized protein n=1 Tax=Argopecten irradians TaxID=31199 RepID=UPI00371CC74E